jgi:thioredoxin 1
MANEHVIEINDSNFAEQALKSPVPVLIDFTAVWCAPCRMIAPTIDALASDYAGRVRVGKCDVDENSELAANLDVRAMPTLMMFKNGEVVGQIVGAVSRAKIEAMVTKALS